MLSFIYVCVFMLVCAYACRCRYLCVYSFFLYDDPLQKFVDVGYAFMWSSDTDQSETCMMVFTVTTKYHIISKSVTWFYIWNMQANTCDFSVNVFILCSFLKKPIMITLMMIMVVTAITMVTGTTNNLFCLNLVQFLFLLECLLTTETFNRLPLK